MVPLELKRLAGLIALLAGLVAFPGLVVPSIPPVVLPVPPPVRMEIRFSPPRSCSLVASMLRTMVASLIALARSLRAREMRNIDSPRRTRKANPPTAIPTIAPVGRPDLGWARV